MIIILPLQEMITLLSNNLCKGMSHISLYFLCCCFHGNTSCSRLHRSSRNVLLRQGSHQPPVTPTHSQWARSHTVSGSRPSQNRGQSLPLPTNPLTVTSTASLAISQNQPMLETLEDFQEVETSHKNVEIPPVGEATEMQHGDEKEEEVRSKVTSDVTMDTEVRRVQRQESVNIEVRQSPGFKFVMRPDLFKFAKVQYVS